MDLCLNLNTIASYTTYLYAYYHVFTSILSKNETYTPNHYANINANQNPYLILTSTPLNIQFLKQYPSRSKRKRKYEQDIRSYSNLKTDHINVSHKMKQMIKSKAYIGKHEHHDLVKFDSDSFPIVMDTGEHVPFQ